MRHRREPTELRLIRLDEELEVFRLTATDDPADPVFEDSFRSRYELDLPPRRNTPEEGHAPLLMGVSVFRRVEQAMETGLRVRARGRNIGDYVARLRLRPDEGFDLADTGSRGHLTIWCDSVKLAASVVDIVPLQQ